MAALDGALALTLAVSSALTTEGTLVGAVALSLAPTAALSATSHLGGDASIVTTTVSDGTESATGSLRPIAHLTGAVTLDLSVIGRMPVPIKRDVATVGPVTGPFTWNHTCAPGATLLIVYIREDFNQVQSVTYNGVGLFFLKGAVVVGGTYWVYVLVNPPPGTHEIKVNCAVSFVTIYTAAVSYLNTRKVVPYGVTADIGAAPSITSAIDILADGSWVVVATSDRSGINPTAGANLTLIAAPGGGASMSLFDSNGPKTPGLKTFTANVTGASALSFAMAFLPALTPVELTGAASLVSLSVDLWAFAHVSPDPGTDPSVYLEIDGIPRIAGAALGGVLMTSLSITDAIDGESNTCSFTVIGMNGYRPFAGQRVLIAYKGPENPSRLFMGSIVQTSQIALPGSAHVPTFACACIDDTWRLSGALVVERYQNKSVTFIAKDLMAKYAPGFTSEQVALNLPVLDEITFTNEDLPDALTQLVRRFGGHWDLDYFGDLMVGTEFVTTKPTPLTLAHPSAQNPTIVRDLTQEANRIFVEGGGVTAIETISPGERFIPVQDAAWYPTNGGVVVSGPQRITYAKAVASTGGTLVGPGAAPVTAPALTLVPDGASHLGVGTYGYAFVDVTPNGRSLAGPIAYVTTGPLGPPPTGPTVGAPFDAVTGVDSGEVDYQITFVLGSGETLPSPVSNRITAGAAVAPPGQAPGWNNRYQGALAGGTYEWAFTWSATGSPNETLVGPRFRLTIPNDSNIAIINLAQPPAHPSLLFTVLGMRLYRTHCNDIGGTLYQTMWSASFSDYVASYGGLVFDSFPDAQLGNAAPTVGTLFNRAVPLSNLPVSPLLAVTAKRLYRRFNQTGAWKRVVELGPAATTYADVIPNASLGADAPSVGTAVLNGVSIDQIAIGASPTNAREIYRTAVNGTQLKLLFRINDNTTVHAPAPIAAPAAIGAISWFANTTPGSSSGAVGPHQWAFTFQRSSDGAETGPSPLSTVVNLSQGGRVEINLGGCSTPPPGYVRVWYRNLVNGSTFYRMPDALNPTYWLINATSFVDVVFDSQMTDPRTMPSAWTGGWLDEAADATLGINAPTGDTSGIPQPAGQVLAGSPSLIVAGAAGLFLTTGGWAIIGNGSHPVRYTGITGNVLTGVPASGPGSITAAVPYNSQVTAADMLSGIPASGVGSIRWTILEGDDVNLLVQVDDPDAQAALSAFLDPNNLLQGRAGVRESYLQDRRLGYTEALARARATLALMAPQAISATYSCRDPLSRSGAIIDIDYPAPMSVTVSLKILSVTISGFGIQNTFPTYQVTAGARFSFEELLRIAEGA